MSLLYECISGIIQGGILDGTEQLVERDQIAELCVGKLRGMITLEGDPNRKTLTSNSGQPWLTIYTVKYVALLAFYKIVTFYPDLVATHQDVILSCIDDADVSIRLLALQLGSGMVNSGNLQIVVNRLMKQLQDHSNSAPAPGSADYMVSTEELATDSDCDVLEKPSSGETLGPTSTQALPNDYRKTIIHHVLDMCCREAYANILDFKWYVDVLIQLAGVLPPDHEGNARPEPYHDHKNGHVNEVAFAVGAELRNIAVRVASVRAYTVRVVNALLDPGQNPEGTNSGARHVLEFAAWIVGEYVRDLATPRETLNLLLSVPNYPTSQILCAYLQAIPKVLSHVLSITEFEWSLQVQAETSLLLARIAEFMESFVRNPNSEVQERSMGYLELLRVSIQAAKSHAIGSQHGPLILRQALPSLFNGQELKPVASAAQKKVPLPQDLDLASHINNNLEELLTNAAADGLSDPAALAVQDNYFEKIKEPRNTAAIDILPNTSAAWSYLDAREASPAPHRARSVQPESRKDDPFYIDSYKHEVSGTARSFQDAPSDPREQDVNLESIPIMSLQIGHDDADLSVDEFNSDPTRLKIQGKAHITPEETPDEVSALNPPQARGQALDGSSSRQRGHSSRNKSVLQVDSSSVSTFQLSSDEISDSRAPPGDKTKDDVEMAKALASVERMRMEMQRASERVDVAADIPVGGALIKKKRKKKKPKESATITQSRQEDLDAETSDRRYA